MTAATTYAPQPGTIDARALAWFADQPPAADASTGVIAAALGQPVAIVFSALERVHEHGLIARERRDGLHFWSTAGRQLRPLGAPPPVCADDDDPIDLLPVRQRTVPAATTTTKETTMTAQPTAAPPQPKKPRTTAPTFDPLKIQLHDDRPLPAWSKAPGASPYRALLERMKPGQSVDLPTAAAKGLVSHAKKAGIKVASRVLSDTMSGVWRLQDDAA